QIKQLFSIENLDLNFESGAIDDSINNNNVRSANEAIKKFVDIYTDNALSSYLINATSNGIEKEFIFNTSSTVNEVLIIVCIISFIISLTILIMISSMIITENEKNIAIFGILGYSNKEKIRMFFSIYLPIILFSTLFAVLIVWLILPVFVSTILSTTSILLSVQLSFSSVCLSILIVSLIFALTFGISWWTQGRIKPIVLLKGV
ncbi:MAG: ABC transporter permease, partial [Mycoplasmataceae bacterium]|nr:ABC transporter permease [Mycoplasmataceae bacterium]